MVRNGISNIQVLLYPREHLLLLYPKLIPQLINKSSKHRMCSLSPPPPQALLIAPSLFAPEQLLLRTCLELTHYGSDTRIDWIYHGLASRSEPRTTRTVTPTAFACGLVALWAEESQFGWSRRRLGIAPLDCEDPLRYITILQRDSSKCFSKNIDMIIVGLRLDDMAFIPELFSCLNVEKSICYLKSKKFIWDCAYNEILHAIWYYMHTVWLHVIKK